MLLRWLPQESSALPEAGHWPDRVYPQLMPARRAQTRVETRDTGKKMQTYSYWTATPPKRFPILIPLLSGPLVPSLGLFSCLAMPCHVMPWPRPNVVFPIEVRLRLLPLHTINRLSCLPLAKSDIHISVVLIKVVGSDPAFSHRICGVGKGSRVEVCIDKQTWQPTVRPLTQK